MKEWSYVRNVFLIVTKNSFRLALRISKIHDSALKSKIADAFILAMYTAFHVVNQAYADAYGKWVSKRTLQQGATLAFNNLLDSLGNAKINAWDAAIALVYPKGSPKYKALLANGHKPFQTGSQEDRIAALNGLIQAIDTDAALATLKAELILFYTEINDADDAQKQLISAVATASSELETARIAMCVAMYADLGGLMQYYAGNTTLIAAFFDLKGIRTGQQELFMGSVKKLSFKKIAKKTVLATDQMLLENTGVTELRFYFAETKDGAIGATFVSVAAGMQVTVNADDLGNVTTNHFLMISNPDTINKGEFTVEFL